MSRRRGAAALTAVVLGISLAGCAPTLPETVVPGTEVVAAWSGAFTSANAAAVPTAANLDIAAMTRAGFGAVVDGEFVPDEGFGTVRIVADDPFTVRYDLAEPAWSDGIPLDAADLLLGWAGAAGLLADGATAAAGPTAAEVTKIDEFARAIEVTFPQPQDQWQSAVPVPVPAHVVGRLAFDTDDAMEAKQDVITAIREGDPAALEKIVQAWHEGFVLPDDGDLPARMLVSSGPFVVESVGSDDQGQRVTLVPNPGYRGPVTPQVARVELMPTGPQPLALVGEALDVAQVAPTAANQTRVRELERRDFVVQTTHDGTVWTVLLNPRGVFATNEARTAFIHAVPARSLIERGAGAWASAYTATTALTAAPGSRAYDIVNEDSGFADSLGTSSDEPAVERTAAGVPDGAQVCVLYDRGSEFAAGAFAALRDGARESGWNVIDCGSDDVDAAVAQRQWDAVITRVPIAQSAAEISAQWGAEGAASITGHSDAERDDLIAELAQTTDVYDARDLRARIEATIVRAAVALPLAVNPRITVVDRDVTGVTARNGSVAPLTSSTVHWAAAG